MKSTVDSPRRPSRPEGRRPHLLFDETGAVFLEFLIVLFPFMFILFGTIQVGLIACASFYTNYANFMALRTAAVRWEMKENGFESDSEFDLKVRLAAMAAIQPIEHWWYKHPFDLASQLDVALRISVNIEAVDDNLSGPSGTNQAGRPKFIKGTTEYKYYLIVPFANYVFGAFDQGISEVSTTESKRVMVNFVTFIPPTKPYPTLTLRSSDDLQTISGTSLPHPHEMVVQRRWLYGSGA